jgi:hypothetical protein
MSGSHQGGGERRSLRDPVNVQNQGAGAGDFDRHGNDRDEEFGGQIRSGQPKCREHAVADYRYDQCRRRQSAQENEAPELLAIGRMEA